VRPTHWYTTSSYKHYNTWPSIKLIANRSLALTVDKSRRLMFFRYDHAFSRPWAFSVVENILIYRARVRKVSAFGRQLAHAFTHWGTHVRGRVAGTCISIFKNPFTTGIRLCVEILRMTAFHAHAIALSRRQARLADAAWLIDTLT